ncbi:universal stress protein [Roseovarius sp. ZX-A-9]|uniref:universal stress protein n=1 Tax=Roseovarius sp. ZX-A-9 TaxID=3014783 RepID=UPI00232B3B4E|nr:universal stress protein [Roseovarius sp. ZX-A-9]MDX1785170.1 universal stress protein [Roseovarius sp.]
MSRSGKPVLCAIDVSNKGLDANVLQEAARMAKMNDAQLDVITVLPDLGMSIVGGYFDKDHHEKALAQASALMREMIEEALGPEANASIRHLVATGSAYEEILKAAKAADSGLIVIGAQKPDLHDFLIGPNASRVVRHANCSVYVVR